MEFIYGYQLSKVSTITKKNHVFKEVIQFMVKTYDFFGIDMEKFKINSKDFDDFIRLSEFYKISVNKIELLSELVNSNKNCLYSMIHGDIGIGNILISKNKIYLIDWASCKKGLLLRDLDCTIYHNSKIYYEEIVRKLSFDQDLHSYECQQILSRLDYFIVRYRCFLINFEQRDYNQIILNELNKIYNLL